MKPPIDTFLNNHVFDGARCDITKALTPNFQVTHSFSMGSSTAPSSYNFGTAFVGQQVSLPFFILWGYSPA
jgi:mitochondrial import receptor subunit TOM40